MADHSLQRNRCRISLAACVDSMGRRQDVAWSAHTLCRVMPAAGRTLKHMLERDHHQIVGVDQPVPREDLVRKRQIWIGAAILCQRPFPECEGCEQCRLVADMRPLLRETGQLVVSRLSGRRTHIYRFCRGCGNGCRWVWLHRTKMGHQRPLTAQVVTRRHTAILRRRHSLHATGMLL